MPRPPHEAGELRKRIKDYLYPSTLQQNADGTWSSFLTWQKVTDGEITGLDLIVLKHDVSRKVVTYLKERTLQFPGVEIQDESLRSYPQGDMAAQLLGHLGEVSAEQLKTAALQGLLAGRRRRLRRPGVHLRQVAARARRRGADRGRRVRPAQADRPGRRAACPTPGDTLVTTIDAKVQAAAEEALRTGISLAHANKQYDANGGAAVVHGRQERRRARHGQLSDLRPRRVGRRHEAEDLQAARPGSRQLPAAEPRRLRRPRRWARRSRPSPRWPPSRRASSRRGPPSGARATTPRRTTTPIRRRSSSAGRSTATGTSPSSAPSRSRATCTSTTSATASTSRKGDGARGLGRCASGWASRPGIDIPGEAAGRVPTPELEEDGYFKTEIDKLWKPSDSIYLAVGQGNLEATPLQLAISYAAIANGGKVVTPHLGLKIIDAAGQTVRDLEPTTTRKVDIAQTTLDVVQQGLYDAANSPCRHVGAGVRRGYKVPVAGKTGTAEVFDNGRIVNYAWYASYAPAERPQVRGRRHDREGRPRRHHRRSRRPHHLRRAVPRRQRRSSRGPSGATDVVDWRALPPAPGLPAAPGDRRARSSTASR